MENSHGSANWCCGSDTPFHVSWPLQSGSSESDWGRFPHGFSASSSSSGNFAADSGGDNRVESLSRSHRQAEQRRRDRINSHLSTLRKLVPNSDKMDKAALLATVIEQVKELKQKAAETTFSNLPTEVDEVTVNFDNVSNLESDSQDSDDKERLIFRASLCCEDHPEVLSEIIRVLKKLQLDTIRADIVCVGGRMRSEFILANKSSGGGTSAAAATALKQSLGVVLNRITSSSSTPSSCRIRSKRQRWFLSSHYSQ